MSTRASSLGLISPALKFVWNAVALGTGVQPCVGVDAAGRSLPGIHGAGHRQLAVVDVPRLLGQRGIVGEVKADFGGEARREQVDELSIELRLVGLVEDVLEIDLPLVGEDIALLDAV